MKDLLFKMLADILAGTDFRLKKSDDAFIRKITDGRQTIGLSLYDYNPEFVFSLVICIRLESVETIFHLFSGSPSPEYQAMSETTITQLEYFMAAPAEFSVTTEQDVAANGRVLSGVVRGKIVPFLDKLQDVKSLDIAVNRQVPGINSTQPPYGPMTSIILAHLAGNPDYDRLVARHRADLNLPPEMDYPFNHLVEYLDKLRSAGPVP
ncbi:MAG: hypothetical protein HYX68_06685 [Planctomycetes bacterium]|nr:hypothetical protein [Planctomycetota bacterium]